ncbi:MAG: hypothetical protein K2O05_00655, partial [Anaeroplasmataceae bacterium]|nr:hypothetical protein [Anaeroplasmataceae bacterium]
MMEFEQIVKELIELGKKNGSVSSREILKYLSRIQLSAPTRQLSMSYALVSWK